MYMDLRGLCGFAGGGAGQAVRPATTVAVKGELKKELGAAHGEADIAASEPQDFMRQAEPRGSVLHEASEHPAQQVRPLRHSLLRRLSFSFSQLTSSEKACGS